MVNGGLIDFFFSLLYLRSSVAAVNFGRIRAPVCHLSPTCVAYAAGGNRTVRATEIRLM